MKTSYANSVLLVPLVVCIAACEGGGECESVAYPALPDGATGAKYVAAGCSDGSGDGSKESPYATIGAAIQAASPGDAVLVAAGTYTENLTVDKAISIVGPSGGARGEEAGIILQAPQPKAIEINGEIDVLIRGVHVVGAAAAGISIRQARVTIDLSFVENSRENDQGLAYGIASGQNGAIILQNSTVTGAAGGGVVLVGSHGTITNSTISNNETGGIRCDRTQDSSRIEGNTLENNALFGVGVFGAGAIILQNEIRGTRGGDGLVVAGVRDDTPMAASVDASENIISGSERAGVLASRNTRHIILQRNTIEESAQKKFAGGLWLQADVGADEMSKVEDNAISGNHFCGVALTGTTHGIILQNNTIENTRLSRLLIGPTDAWIGDGISLMKSASAQITGNKINSSGRIGLLVDNATAEQTSVQDNFISKSDRYGIILQNQAVPPMTFNNRFDANRDGDQHTIGASEAAFAVKADELTTE